MVTVPPEALRSVRVIGWLPLADAWVPWFFSATEKSTLSPPVAELGVQSTEAATRSLLCTGETRSGVGAVYSLLPSSCSTTVSSGSTTAATAYSPESCAPVFAVTVRVAPGASVPTSAV